MTKIVDPVLTSFVFFIAAYSIPMVVAYYDDDGRWRTRSF